MNKLQEIFKAWNIAFDPNNEQAELAAKRIDICNACDKKVTNLGINRCSVCGCALKGKVFSPVKGACPEGKWDEVDGLIEKTMYVEIPENSLIFVQIASYRDPELIPTIRHCLERAKYPENLRFGIVNQFNPEDSFHSLREFETNPNFRILNIHYTQSKGACWARNKANKLYENEFFTLQIDSHMRFTQDWDEILLNLWKDLKDDKAVFTGYPPNYTPGQTEEQWYKVPQICNIYTFNGKYPVSRPMNFPDLATATKPRKGMYISAGFLFARGHFIDKVPYDPEFYFGGEELALAVRAFTHGYNIIHPHKLILHHYYARYDESKHWGDHKDWGVLNIEAHKRLDTLLGRNTDIDLGIYGVGTERTLQDYIKYSGVDFYKNIVNLDTKEGKEPPVTDTPERWDYHIVQFDKTLIWDYDELKLPEDLRFIALIVKDKNDIAVDRVDITSIDYPDLKNYTKTEHKFTFTYLKDRQEPATLMVWPYSEKDHWVQSKTFPIKIK